MMYTVLTGNPIDGYRAWNVFNTNEDAWEWGDKQNYSIDWVIMPIHETGSVIERDEP